MGSQVMHACNSHFIASQTLLIVLAEPNVLYFLLLIVQLCMCYKLLHVHYAIISIVMWNTLMVYRTDTYTCVRDCVRYCSPSLCLLACYHSPLFIVYVLALNGFQLQCWLQSILQLPQHLPQSQWVHLFQQ